MSAPGTPRPDLMQLQTDRLILTRIGETDFDELCALWSDPAFAVPLFPSPPDSEHIWLRLLRDIGHWQVRGYGNLAVRMKDTGEYIGSVGILDYRRVIEPPLTSPELGWGIAPRFQGKGLAYEAARAAIDWCDQVLKAPRTCCIISPDNSASLSLAARLGYRIVRQSDFHGEPIHVLERVAPH